MAATNLAGQTSILASCLREVGVDALSLVFTKNNFGYDADILLPLSDYPRIIKYFIKVWYFLRAVLGFDIMHFHGGRTLFKGFLDLPLYRLLGKKTVMHFHGRDVRNPQIIIARGRGGKIPPIQTPDQIARLEFLRKYVDKFIVSTPDLLELVPEATYLPLSAGEEWFSELDPKSSNEVFTIVHAPTSRSIKGTKQVLAAVGNLKRKGYKIKLLLVENVLNDKVREFYEQADVFVDQLLVGWHGVAAIENMAIGNPVVSYIKPELRKKYAPDLPIINATKNNIQEVLESLIKDKNSLAKSRPKFREYAIKYHHPLKNAKRLIKIYEKL